MNTSPFFLGIDVGTQGCRVVLADRTGTQIDARSAAFLNNAPPYTEQSPDQWWLLSTQLIKQLIRENKSNISPADILSVGVTSTSGTVIPLDDNFQCLHPAIMYSDKRSAKEGELCKSMAEKFLPGGYKGFNSSSGLSKMIWFMNHFPDKMKSLRHWVHASDFITGKLSDNWKVTDYTNVLKSGFDLNKKEWPDYIFSKLGLRKEWMPAVLASGEPITKISSSVAAELGLSRDTIIVTGMTDGCASQIASGAAMPGDWNTTIGTTLVVKGITCKPVDDPEGRLYNHLHPQGYWMPGGASNIGADWVTKNFQKDFDKIEKDAASLIPTGVFSYPLDGIGERFPFVAPAAEGFIAPGLSVSQQFASCMEGVSFIERYAFDVIKKLIGEDVKTVYVAGGAASNATWLNIRSNVLNRPLIKMRNATGSFGAAILAASKTYFTSMGEATTAMSVIEKEIHPERVMTHQYDDLYHKFMDLIKNKGYLNAE